MVNLTIDGIKIRTKEGTTIKEAAFSAGIKIPQLCYLKDINEISACKVCVVELEGMVKLVTACNNAVEEGMVVYTNSKKARATRRKNVEFILSEHDMQCAVCARSRNCNLQNLANDLGILELPFHTDIKKNKWEKTYPFIKNESKCIKCMRCVQICDKVQSLNVWDVQNTGARTTVDVRDNKTIDKSDCSVCGQCVTHCPTGALHERNDLDKIYAALDDPEIVTIVQVAPAVRTAWGEGQGMPSSYATEKRMVAVLKRIGFDYVFDTNFAADLTIMEEGKELIERLEQKKEGDFPMFTSCCPAWVSFVKTQYPNLVPYLSTAKSPQQMFGVVTKTYFAEHMGIPKEKICSISIMPCTAKKKEATLEDMNKAGAGQDVDIVLTTREFIRLIRAQHIEPITLKEMEFDSPLGEGSGAAVIFGTTGGVMEAALRSVVYLKTGENPTPEFKSVRGGVERKKSTFEVGEEKISTCTVNGLKNARELIEDLYARKVSYDFVEVMACPGGCVGGGGQPITDGVELAENRKPKLYHLDETNPVRFSHENKEVAELYHTYLNHEEGLAHKLLHTHHGIH